MCLRKIVGIALPKLAQVTRGKKSKRIYWDEEKSMGRRKAAHEMAKKISFSRSGFATQDADPGLA